MTRCVNFLAKMTEILQEACRDMQGQGCTEAEGTEGVFKAAAMLRCGGFLCYNTK